MATFPIIYKADGTNKVIIQYGKNPPTFGYMYTNFKVTEIKQLEDNTFIIEHIPIKTITKNAGNKSEETISNGTISFLCLKDDSGTIVLDYCDDSGKIITQPDDPKYGKFRTNPFYFEVDNVVFPSGDYGVTFEKFFKFLEGNPITLGEKQLNFDEFFFKKEQGGNGRKMRKRRQSRKKYASKKSKKYRRSRKRKGSRKKRY